MSDPAVTADSLLAPLNAPQRDAVTTTKGPVLVLAGRGQRQDARHRPPHRLSPRASRASTRAHVSRSRSPTRRRRRCDIASRLSLLPAGIRPPLISTFHSDVRAHPARARRPRPGCPPSFVIYDEDDRQTPGEGGDARARLRRARADAGRRGAPHQPREEPDAVASRTWSSSRARRARSASPRSTASTKSACRPPGGVDFDDLLLRVVRLLETVPQALDWYRSLWKHVLVDEYQDTNRAQYRIVQHAHRGAPEPLRRGRSRPVGLSVARRGSPQHPRLREGLPGLPGDRRSSRTTARPSASSRSPPR